MRTNIISELVEYLKGKYEFKYNEITSKISYKEKEHKEFTIIDDKKLNTLYLECKSLNQNINYNDFTVILKSDVSVSINPFKEYFEKLPKWDEKTDYIRQLCDTITTSKPHYFRTYFKKWIVGVVGCAIDENITNHLTIILLGSQGIGKTTWLNKLLPNELKEYIYMGAINPSNKDSLIHLSECMFINIDEFETIGKKDLNRLKSIITQNEIRIRRPYDRFHQKLIRRASFMASVNDSKCLVDSTGNRRFLVFDINKINIKHKVNMDMVYSQCLHLLNTGFRFFLNERDTEKVNKMNEQYVLKTFEEELLLNHFKPTQKGTGEVLTTTQIFQRIIEKSQGRNVLNNNSIIILGRALSKNSFVKGRTKDKAHGWWVWDKSKRPIRKDDFRD